MLETMDSKTFELANGNNVDEIFLKLAKGFDTVPHKRLLHKLRAYGLSRQMVEWFRDFWAELT